MTSIEHEDTHQWQKYLPKGFDRNPETPAEALRATRSLFVDEIHWVKNSWFAIRGKSDPTDAFCVRWVACLLGALGLVTIGACRPSHTSLHYYPLWVFNREQASSPDDLALFEASRKVLEDVISVDHGVKWLSVVDFNDDDRTSFDQVIKILDQAITFTEDETKEEDVR